MSTDAAGRPEPVYRVALTEAELDFVRSGLSLLADVSLDYWSDEQITYCTSVNAKLAAAVPALGTETGE